MILPEHQIRSASKFLFYRLNASSASMLKDRIARSISMFDKEMSTITEENVPSKKRYVCGAVDVVSSISGTVNHCWGFM